MKVLRRVVFWCHLVAGVIAGTIILVMSVTGVLLTYERQILAWADTHSYRAPPSAQGAGRTSATALVAAVQAVNPDATITTLTMWADPEAPVAVAAGTRTFYVSPYSAQVLGEGAARTRAFFRRVTDWHRWLGVAGERRATARMISGACNLAFLFLVASGLYLWVPRGWSWLQVRGVAWFRGGLRGRARDFNWHNVIGLWSSVPLFVIVLDGVVISYPWASDLVYRVVGETPPPRAAPARRVDPQAGNSAGIVPRPVSLDLDALWARAEREVDGWRSISMRLPSSAAAPVTFTIDTGDGGQPQKRTTLTLDGRTADVLRSEPFSGLTRGRRLRSYLRFAHTGEVAGLVGQSLAGLASAGGAVLVWTGISMACRRLRARLTRRNVRTSTRAA